MKKRGLIIFDVVMSIVIILGLCFGTKIVNNEVGVTESKFLAENQNLNFNVSATPEYQKVLAGSTVKIKVDVKKHQNGRDSD